MNALLFSKQDLRKIIVPLLIEQTLAITVGMLDAVMVASAGEAAVSAVSLVDPINLLLFYVFNALAAGGAVVTAQLLGKGRADTAQEVSKQLIWSSTIVAAVLTLLAIVFKNSLLSLVFGKISADVMADARSYFFYTALAYPFIAVYNACSAVFRAGGNSKISMTTSLMMNGINLVGNAVLIYVFHMGAAGAAIATLFSRIVGAIFLLCRICSPRAELRIDRLWQFRPQWQLIKRICWIGVPNGIESGMFQIGKILTQSLISGFGTMQIAANAVAGSLSALHYVPGNAIGLTLVVVVGRCVGAGEKEQVRHYTKRMVGLTYVLIVVLAVLMAIFVKPLVGLYNLSDEAAALAQKIMLLQCACVSVIWPLAFTTPHAFRASSDVRFPTIISASSMWIFRVGLSVVLGKYLHMGVMGVWIAMYCDWIFRAVVFTVHYIKGKWQNQYQNLT